MYRTIILGLLLSGCISESTDSSTTSLQSSTIQASLATSVEPKTDITVAHPTPELPVPPEQTTPGGKTGTRSQLAHSFSEPVIIVIILAVMGGVIAVILLLAWSISKLSKKRSPNIQPPSSHDIEAHLSSVETGNPESNQ